MRHADVCWYTSTTFTSGYFSLQEQNTDSWGRVADNSYFKEDIHQAKKKENSTSTCIHIGVCVCWEDEGEAAAEEEDSEEAVGWAAELEAEEAEAPAAPAAAAAADDELSVKLLCVMKRSRNFMAGRSVMMIFSTLEKHNERFTGK